MGRPPHAAGGLRAGSAAGFRDALQNLGQPVQRRSKDFEYHFCLEWNTPDVDWCDAPALRGGRRGYVDTGEAGKSGETGSAGISSILVLAGTPEAGSYRT